MRTFFLFIFVAGQMLPGAAVALNNSTDKNLHILPQVHDIGSRDTVAFSPDGKIMATTEKNRSLIQLWNVDGFFLRQWGSNQVSGARFGNLNMFLASFNSRGIDIWDPVDGKLQYSIADSTGGSRVIEGIDLSPDDTLIATYGYNWVYTGNAFISIWDIKKKVWLLNKAETTPRQHVRGLYFVDGGKAIATYLADTVTISDLKGNKISEWTVEGITDLSVRKAGKEILCSSKDTVTVWTLGGKLLYRFDASRHVGPLPYPPIKNVASLPGSDNIVTLTNSGFQAWGPKGGLLWEHFRPEVGPELSWMYGFLGMAISPDGKSIALRTPLGPLDLWDTSAQAMKGNFSRQANRINGFTFFPDEDIVTTSLRVIDRTGMVKSNLIPEVGDLGVSTVRALRMADTRQLPYKKDGGVVTGVNTSANYVLASPDGNMIAVVYMDGYVRLFDRKWRLINRFPEKASYMNHYLPPLAFSQDSKKLAVFKSWYIVIHDISSGKVISEIPLGKQSSLTALQFLPDGKTLLVGDLTDGIKLIDLESKKTLLDDKGNILRSVPAPGGDCADILAHNSKKELVAGGRNACAGTVNFSSRDASKRISSHISGVTDSKFSADGAYLFAAYTDGMLKIWNTRNWQEVSLMSSTDDEWIIYTPDGYFDASPHGGELLAVVDGLDAHGIEQFAARNNRPDLILERMGFGTPEQLSFYQLLYQKRLKKLGLTEAMLSSDPHVPEAKIVKTALNGKFMDIGFEFSDEKYPLKSFNIFVNNIPLYGEVGREIDGKSFTGTEKIELGDGRNKIEISVMNTVGAESYRAFTYADYNNKELRNLYYLADRKGADKLQYKAPELRNLYYLAFGVSKFKDPVLNLNYADKDAKDLETEILKMGASYNKIYTKTFLNSDVTAVNFKKAKDFLKEAKVDDTVILLVAGHGGYDKGSDPKYYYLPYDADPGNLTSTGVLFGNIEDLLADIKPRKKLLLLDTCESGELEDDVYAQYLAMANERGFKPRTYRKPIKARGTGAIKRRGYLLEKDRFIYNNLARRSGTVVFSSSRGNEISYESPSIKNGFFSREIINALTDKAADKDLNGKISINELKTYVRSAVSKDTGGLQNPTIDWDNLSQKIELPLLSN